MMKAYRPAVRQPNDAATTPQTGGCARASAVAWCRFLMAGVVTIGLYSCSEPGGDAEQTERVRRLTVPVRTVIDSGLTLDENATPQQVVYALLQAIKDDVRAGHDQEARQRAIDRQLALCAPVEIDLRFGGPRSIETREQAVYRVVNLWGAVVGYYADSLDGDLAAMSADMEVTALPPGRSDRAGTGELRKVILPLPDPQAPDDPRRRARLRVDLARESDRWRVCHVGYEPRRVVKTPITTPESDPHG